MFEGLVIGIFTFLTIGLFHPLVIWVEYHFGRRVWWAFLLLAVLFLVGSLFCREFLSLIFGVLGASFFWSAVELHYQHRRACRGQAKRNPRRSAEYYES